MTGSVAWDGQEREITMSMSCWAKCNAVETSPTTLIE